MLGLEIAAPFSANAPAADAVADVISAEMENLSEDELAALLDSNLDEILGKAVWDGERLTHE